MTQSRLNNNTLLSWDEIQHIFPHNQHVRSDITIDNITIDSRKITHNALFVALKTAQNDGHYYIDDALQQGAALAVSHASKPYYPNPDIIYCRHTDNALPAIARYKRQYYNCTWVGVTGSVGKTSLKNMIGFMLQESHCYKSQKNLNNMLGVPFNMAHVTPDHRIAVLEAGMSKAGELDYIGAILQPHISIITNIGMAHIENFMSPDGIRNAKAELCRHTVLHGVIILPYNCKHDDYWQQLINERQARIYYFSMDNPESDFYLASYQLIDNQAHIACCINGQDIMFHTSVLGQHHALNMVVALGVCAILGVDNNTMLARLTRYNLDEGRGEYTMVRTPHLGVLHIYDESYNASTPSFKAVIDTMHQSIMPNNRKIAVIGDMAELGDYANDEHNNVLDYLMRYDDIYCIVIGPIFSTLAKTRHHPRLLACFSNSIEASNMIETYLKHDDILLFKGAHSMDLNHIIAHLKQYNL